MTEHEHVCMNPTHDHFDPEALTESQLTSVTKLHEAYDLIDGLPGNEERALLAQSALDAAHTVMYGALQAFVSGALQTGVEAMGAAMGLVALGGVALEKQAEVNDWQKTGDRRVDAVLKAFAEATEAARASAAPVLKATDLPPEMAERLVAGEATEEDKSFIKQLAVEKGLIDEDDDLPLFTRDVETGETKQVTTANHTADDDKGHGMYL
jgi:hypothetical protein